jgi:hypothetical protein
VSNVLPAPADPWAPSGKIAGYTIGLCAVLMMLAISMHPHLEHQHGAEAVAAIGRLAPMLNVVHATVIVFVIALFYGFTVYSMRRGVRSQAVLGALVAYAAGAGAFVLAALIDGFVVPTVSANYVGLPKDVLQVGLGVLNLCGVAIQILSKFGVIAMSAAIVLWSADLLRDGAFRGVAALGAVAAVTPIVVLFAEGPAIVAATLSIIVIAQGIWYLAIATLLVRERV